MIFADYRAFLHEVTVATLVFQTSPVGVDLFSFVNAFSCSNKLAYILVTWVKTLYTWKQTINTCSNQSSSPVSAEINFTSIEFWAPDISPAKRASIRGDKLWQHLQAGESAA